MQASSSSKPKTIFPRPLLAFVTWGLSYIAARLLVAETALAYGIKVALALLPLVPFVWMVFELVRSIRKMDELQRQIHLEALVIAYPLCILSVMKLGLLELFTELPIADWSYRHMIPFFFLYYFAGLFIARKRYGL